MTADERAARVDLGCPGKDDHTPPPCAKCTAIRERIATAIREAEADRGQQWQAVADRYLSSRVEALRRWQQAAADLEGLTVRFAKLRGALAPGHASAVVTVLEGHLGALEDGERVAYRLGAEAVLAFLRAQGGIEKDG